MAEAAERLVVSLEARIRDFERNFQRASQVANDNWRTIERRGEVGAKKIESTFSQAAEGISSKFRLMATSAAGALTAALGVSKLREYADEWTAAGSKIAAAGEELDNVAQRQSQLTDLANRSRTSLSSVVDLYSGLTRSTKEMGASQAQVLRATELISKAFSTSGATVEETKGAILQLNQALGSGRLQGDELRSLLENAPSLARLIAKEFGVALGELKQLGSDGKLTSDRVFKAILNGAAEIEAEFAKTTPTIAQSWTILTNSLQRYVGETDQAVGASKLVSGALKGMADHIDVVAPAAFSLATGLAAAFAGGPVVGGITAATVALVGFSDKIHPIPGELASLADYAGVAWTLIKDKGGEAATYLQQQFAAAADHISAALQSVGGSGMGDLLAAVKVLGNSIIAAFDIAASTIKISFMSIGPTIAETMTNAVNHTIADIEAMANKVIEAVNRIAKAFGQVGQISKIELGRVGNTFAGSSEQAGKAIGKAIRDAIGKDYIGDIGHGLQQLRERANEAARKRQEAARPKPHDDGSLDAPLKPGKDPEEAKKAEEAKKEAEAKAKKQIEDYDKIVAKAREFIETQEIERQALSMDAQAASALKHEHEMLNQAKEHGIELTDKQKDQIHQLASDMASAEEATKSFKDTQEQLKQFGDTISGELTSALEGLVTGSTKLEDVWKRLALLFAKMALEAVLLGKGPLAGLFGIKDGGLLGGTPFGGSLGDAFASMWGGQSASRAPLSAAPAIEAASATPAAPASATTQAAVSAVTPKFSEAVQQVAQAAIEKASPNIPTPPSRPSDLTPSAPLPPRRPNLASDGLPEPVPPEIIPHVGGSGFNAIGRAGGSRSWRNNNPGNIEYGPFAKSKGAIGSDGRFAIFPSEEAGTKAQETLLFEGKNYRGLSVGQAIGKWAPSSENNVPAYVGAVTKGLDGVGANTPMSALTPEQRQIFLRNMRQHEGWKPGRMSDKQQVDMTPTGSIQKAQQAAQQQTQAVQQQIEAQRRLQEQLTKASQATQQVSQPLQGMDAGVGKLAGSLQQGVPATEGFAGELEKLIQQLLSGLGGGGGGLGGIGEALGGILGFADGGHVSGPGGPTSDSIPAMLSNGEFVVNAKATGKHGALLEMINSGKAPRFAVGGLVGGTSLAHATTYAPSTTINVSGSGNPKQDARFAGQVADAVGAALAQHQRPDTFRRNSQQAMAAAFRTMGRAHTRHG